MADTDKSAYNKGYKAGRKFGAKESALNEKEAFRRAVFLAALTGTLQSGGWTTGDKNWKSPRDFCHGAWHFADEAMKGARFT